MGRRDTEGRQPSINGFEIVSKGEELLARVFMYNPSPFKVTDQELLLKLIEEYPLGTLVNFQLDQIHTSYIPFIAEAVEGKIKLLGHIAKANDHWQGLTQSPALVSFRGPDRYISPTRYSQKLNVPTWNYAVVEARGTFEVLHDPHQIEKILEKSVMLFEGKESSSWRYDLPEKFKQNLLKNIVGLQMNVEHIEGKFKLGRNRSAEDYQSLLESLESSASSSDQNMVQWMKNKP